MMTLTTDDQRGRSRAEPRTDPDGLVRAARAWPTIGMGTYFPLPRDRKRSFTVSGLGVSWWGTARTTIEEAIADKVMGTKRGWLSPANCGRGRDGAIVSILDVDGNFVARARSLDPRLDLSSWRTPSRRPLDVPQHHGQIVLMARRGGRHESERMKDRFQDCEVPVLIHAPRGRHGCSASGDGPAR
jgi:hypothetical protein